MMFHSPGLALVSLLLGNWSSGILIQANPTTEHVPGLFKLNSTPAPPIYYNTYAPIVLEYRMPTFDTESLTLSPVYATHSFCNDDRVYDRVCPNTFFIKQLISGSFAGNLSSWNSLPGPRPDPGTHLSSSSSSFCDELGPHFPDFHTSGPSLEKYLAKLRKCSFGDDGVISRNLSDYDYDLTLKAFYANFSGSTERTFYAQADSQHDDVITLNAHTGAYAIFLVHMLMESQRWAAGVESCRAGRIPHTLVSTQRLLSALQGMNGKLGQRDLKPAIEIADLSKYYKLPLTDCVLTEGSLVVRILVPLVDRNADLEHIRIGAIPFLKANQICTAVKAAEREFVHDKSAGQLLESACTGDQLCRLPRHASDWPFTSDHCISSYLRGDKGAVTLHCHFECFPYSRPVFKTVNGSTVVLAQESPTNITIHCPGRADGPVEIEPADTYGNSSAGAFRINLPCNCSIVHNHRTIFETDPFHCDPRLRKVLVTHIMPYAWEGVNSTAWDPEIIDYDGNLMNLFYEYETEDSTATAAVKGPEDTPQVQPASSHTGFLYFLAFSMLLVVGVLTFVVFKVMKIQRWQQGLDFGGDKHPIMSYHVFNNQDNM